jgi:hypothetical protein
MQNQSQKKIHQVLLFCDPYFCVVAVKKSQEGRLGACGPLHAAEADIVPRPLDVSQIPEQLLPVGLVSKHSERMRRTRLDPQRGPLTDGGQLRGLVVREPERGEGAVLLREGRQTGDDHRERA